MSLEKRTRLERVTTHVPTGTIEIQLYKEVVDGGKVLFSEPHRTTIAPGADVEQQMGEVNRHLVEMGMAPVTDFQAVRDHAAIQRKR